MQNNQSPTTAVRSKTRLGAIALLAALVAGAAVPQAAFAQGARRLDVPRTNEERGVTKPLHEPKLAFPTQGVVMKLNVAEGDDVTEGQVLGVLDDRAEQAAVKVAESTHEAAKQQIEAAVADLENKGLKLKRVNLLYADLLAKGQKNVDIEEAELGVKIGEIAVAFRKLELAQEEQKLGQAKVQVEQKQLKSPITGSVVKIDLKVGEGADLSRPAVQVVDISTLYVEVDVPTGNAKGLKAGQGQKLEVRYTDEDKYMSGDIIFVSAYANPSSNTRKVRLKMANEAKREAGVPVFVKLPEPAVAAGK